MTKRDEPLDIAATDDAEAPEGQEQVLCYFLGTAQVLYNRQGQLKQRNINVVLELAHPMITRGVILEAQRSAMIRLQQELGVEPDSVKDIVWLSFSFLGQMPASVFNSMPETPLATAGQPLEDAADLPAKKTDPRKRKAPVAATKKRSVRH